MEAFDVSVTMHALKEEEQEIERRRQMAEKQSKRKGAGLNPRLPHKP